MNAGGEWRDRDVSFNNFLSGVLMLFELFTGEGWYAYIDYIVDAVGIDWQPRREENLSCVWFLVAYMIIGYFFVRAMVTGVINDTFFKQKQIIQGVSTLKTSQRMWMRLSKIIFKATPIRAVNSLANWDSMVPSADCTVSIASLPIQSTRRGC